MEQTLLQGRPYTPSVATDIRETFRKVRERMCPECRSDDVTMCHRDADGAFPETDWKRCEGCGHEWGHE